MAPSPIAGRSPNMQRGSPNMQRGLGSFGTPSFTPKAGMLPGAIQAASPYLASVSCFSHASAQWTIGSIVEYFSAAASCWIPAMVADVSKDNATLVVQFVGTEGIQHRSVPRGDSRMAPLGSNEKQLPPSFHTVPSQTRPGQFAYIDTASGLKYGSIDLAWKTHLERLFHQNSGQPTICDTTDDSSSKHFHWPSEFDLEASRIQSPIDELLSEDTESVSPRKRWPESNDPTSTSLSAARIDEHNVYHGSNNTAVCIGLANMSTRGQVPSPASKTKSPGLWSAAMADPSPSPSVVPVTTMWTSSSAQMQQNICNAGAAPVQQSSCETVDVEKSILEPLRAMAMRMRAEENAVLSLPKSPDVETCNVQWAKPRPAPAPWKKIASLEGALDESRDHVAMLEGALNRTQDVLDTMRVVTCKPLTEDTGCDPMSPVIQIPKQPEMVAHSVGCDPMSPLVQSPPSSPPTLPPPSFPSITLTSFTAQQTERAAPPNTPIFAMAASGNFSEDVAAAEVVESPRQHSGRVQPAALTEVESPTTTESVNFHQEADGQKTSVFHQEADEQASEMPSVCSTARSSAVSAALSSIQDYDQKLAGLQREIEERKAQARVMCDEHGLREQELATWRRLSEDVPWFKKITTSGTTDADQSLAESVFGLDFATTRSPTASSDTSSHCFTSESRWVMHSLNATPRSSTGKSQRSTTPQRTNVESKRSNTPQRYPTSRRSGSSNLGTPHNSPQAAALSPKLPGAVSRPEDSGARPLPRAKSPRRGSQFFGPRWKDIGVSGKPLDSKPVSQWQTTYQTSFAT